MNVSSQNISLIQILTKIFKNLSLRRKKQLGVLSTLILISSTCEILILSSVQPFLLALEKSNNNNIINKSNGYFSQIFFNDQQSLISLLLIFIFLLIISAVLRLLNIFLNNYFAASLGNELGSSAYSNCLY